MNCIDIANMNFNFGKKTVLENVNLKFEEGINVILGPNGCGKSTLLKLAATIYPYKIGEITLNNVSYKSSQQNIKDQIAYLPQNFNVYPALKVVEFLKLIFNIKTGSCDQNELKNIMDITGVADFQYVKMKKLSEGMRKLVGIAQAIIGDPKMIILDEPTAGLDPENRSNFNSIIRNVSKGRIVLISTHIIEDIMPYYDTISVIENKKVVFSGKSETFFHSLDNKIYSVEVDMKDIEQIEKKYMVLSENFENGKTILKITGNINSNENFKFIPCSANVTDLWNFYRKKNHED